VKSIQGNLAIEVNIVKLKKILIIIILTIVEIIIIKNSMNKIQLQKKLISLY